MKALRFSDAQKAFILKEMLMGFRWRPFAAANGQHEGALAGPASNQSSDLMLSVATTKECWFGNGRSGIALMVEPCRHGGLRRIQG
jgi:hypothetical protein